MRKIYLHTGQIVKKGKGVGSVLLNGGMGGPGVGSSYSSLEDYIETTNQNPFIGQPRGMGISKNLGNKLETLLVKTKKGRKDKNITFNL